MNFFQMEVLIKETTSKIKWRDKENTSGQEDRSIRVNLRII